jgi:Ribonuclease G/E
MTGRRQAFLDASPGETRAVVTLDGRPERLLIVRDGDIEAQRLGARVLARVRRIERGLASAFLDMGEGPDAVLPLAGHARALVEGSAVEVVVIAEARSGKGAVVRLDGPGEGPPRLLAAGPGLAKRLAAWTDAPPVEGPAARDAADLAEAQALAVEHGLPGGGSIAIESTRALVAVDVDLGARLGADAARRTLGANLAAIKEAARLLRLKALGGLVVIDLAGRGQDGPALLAAAKAAFAPDEPGVSLGPISRFGTLTLAVPHRDRPLTEILLDDDRLPTPRTVAHRLVRAMERQGRADPGGRIAGVCSVEVAAQARPWVAALGPRFSLQEEVGRARLDTDIRTP